MSRCEAARVDGFVAGPPGTRCWRHCCSSPTQAGRPRISGFHSMKKFYLFLSHRRGQEQALEVNTAAALASVSGTHQERHRRTGCECRLRPTAAFGIITIFNHITHNNC
jgi:hypothetical protein